MNKEIILNFTSMNKRNNIIHIKEDNYIGYLSLIFDEESKIYDGILVLDKCLEREAVFKVGQMIQHEFVASDEGMFIETYFGVKFGMICDETPSNWEKILKK
ncbi:MAG: hypothetical protein RR265_01920 [Cetobacterium sp.]|uniref:hypothetical protein n=1 Tax=Cetobacterium sp. TaxID=2071632 RepID=UPI002FC8F6F4